MDGISRIKARQKDEREAACYSSFLLYPDHPVRPVNFLASMRFSPAQLRGALALLLLLWLVTIIRLWLSFRV
jgi:hypothetical protein